MDWRLVGAVTSATLACGLLAVAVTALVVSDPGEHRKVPTSPTLLVESQGGRLTEDLRPTAYSEAHDTHNEPQVGRLLGPGETHDTDSEPEVGRLLAPDASPEPSTEPSGRPSKKAVEKAMTRPSSSSDHTKLASPSVQARTEPVNGGKIKESTDQHLSSDSMAKRPSSSVHTKQASPSAPTPLPAQPKISTQEWKAIPTAGASLFNLGGHLDQSGLVDNMASPRLRDAFKKVKNYNKLPLEAKAWIEEPNINLSKLAPYRALLGMDDRKIEQEQAVKFIRIASSRGIEVVVLPTSEEGDADLLELPPFN